MDSAPQPEPRPVALVVLLLTTAAALSLAPLGAWLALQAPSTRAGVLMLGVIAAIFVLRRRGRAGARLEYLALCVFLAGMPLIYVESVLWHGAGRALAQELLGFAVFAAWAWWAARRGAWTLAGGVALHGMAWDAWHLHSAFIAAWYPPACWLVDLGFAAYIALERQRFDAAAPRAALPLTARASS